MGFSYNFYKIEIFNSYVNLGNYIIFLIHTFNISFIFNLSVYRNFHDNWAFMCQINILEAGDYLIQFLISIIMKLSYIKSVYMFKVTIGFIELRGYKYFRFYMGRLILDNFYDCFALIHFKTFYHLIFCI